MSLDRRGVVSCAGRSRTGLRAVLVMQAKRPYSCKLAAAHARQYCMQNHGAPIPGAWDANNSSDI
jgi:hypothetical protein